MPDSTTSKWFYVKDGQRHGPVDMSELVEMIIASKLARSTPVWRPGQGRWRSADSVPDFVAHVPPPIEAATSAAARPPVAVSPPATESFCATCDTRLTQREEKELSGSIVCPSCWYGFANRRQMAFALDALVYCFAILGLSALVTLSNPSVVRPLLALKATALEVLVWAFPAFLLKDGFAGYSPGKYLMGVQTIDADTRQPAGFVASFKRNLPLLIPFMPLVAGWQLKDGTRLGDGWANTSVVNRQVNWIFQVSAQAVPERVARREYYKRAIVAGGLGFALPLYIVTMLADLRPISSIFKVLGR